MLQDIKMSVVRYQNLKTNNKISSLDPFTDMEGILCVGSRLNKVAQMKMSFIQYYCQRTMLIQT